MKILTWNCCLPPWVFDRRERRISIAQEILKIDLDVTCLQEVFSKGDAKFFKQQLQKNGFNHHSYFKDLLISSKIPIIKSKGFVFKNQGNLFSSSFFDVIYEKGFQRILLEDNTCIINTHLLSACGSIKENIQSARRKQVEEICQSVDEDNVKIIILGDFNFIPDSKSYAVLYSYGFKECFNSDVRTHGNKKLDHIFIKDVECINREIIFADNLYSDHKGLLIEI